MKHLTLPLAAVVALAAPAVASAHVTLQPSEAAADSYTVLDVRVPNETDDTRTTKVDVQFPAGFLYAATEPVPGWKAKVVTAKLPEPVEQHGEQVTERVDRVVFTATGRGVSPGEFQDFPVSLKLPDGKAGEKLTFKALQTYSDGEVVRWIGAPDADRPAPQVTLTAADGDHHSASAGNETVANQGAAASRGGDGSGDDGSGSGLAIVALVVGAVGVLIGGAGLLTARRATSPA